MQFTDILEPLILADRFLTGFIHDAIPHTPYLDATFAFLSVSGNSLILWVLILLLLLLLEGRKHKSFPLFLFTATTATFLFVEFVLKNLYGRTRPIRFNDTLLAVCPQGYAFPSGHAAVAFAAAFIFSYFDKKRMYFYYIVATLICLSRIYLGCHYFADVVGGMIVGTIIAKITTLILEKRTL